MSGLEPRPSSLAERACDARSWRHYVAFASPFAMPDQVLQPSAARSRSKSRLSCPWSSTVRSRIDGGVVNPLGGHQAQFSCCTDESSRRLEFGNFDPKPLVRALLFGDLDPQLVEDQLILCQISMEHDGRYCPRDHQRDREEYGGGARCKAPTNATRWPSNTKVRFQRRLGCRRLRFRLPWRRLFLGLGGQCGGADSLRPQREESRSCADTPNGAAIGRWTTLPIAPLGHLRVQGHNIGTCADGTCFGGA